MKFVSSRAAAVAAAMALLVGASLFAADANLTGVVKDENGTPIPGAKVTVTSPKAKDLNASITTDESGAFSTAVPNGKWPYQIRVEHDGFSPSQVETPSVVATGMSITLHPPF